MLTAVLHHLTPTHSACVWELRRLVPVVKSSAGVSSGLQGGHLDSFTAKPLCCNKNSVVILLK